MSEWEGKPIDQIGKKDIDDRLRDLWDRQAAQEAARFEALSFEEWCADQKYQADNIEVMGVLLDWSKKAKKGSKAMETLNRIFLCVMRMNAHKMHLDTVSRMASMKYFDEKRRREKVELHNGELQKEIENLKQQIEFHEKNP